MSGGGDDDGISDELFGAVLEQVESEEGDSIASLMASQDGFQVWFMSQDALRRFIPVEKISQIIPAIFSSLRALFSFGGADGADGDDDDGDLDGEIAGRLRREGDA